MRRDGVLLDALERLRALPPIHDVRQIPGPKSHDRQEFDALVEVETDRGMLEFAIEVKPVLKRPLPQHLSIRRQRTQRPFLLVSEYVNSSIAESLKEEGINFIDSRGSAYINLPGHIYVDVRADKPEGHDRKRRTVLFQPKGLQLLFILLTDRSAVNQTTRTLAARAGISLERAVSSMKELRERSFAHETRKKQYQLTNKRDLLDRWLAGYGDRLRPSLELGSFRIPPSLEQQVPNLMMDVFENRPGRYAIGGSLGAYLLTRHYRGHTNEVFIPPESAGQVKQRLKLIPGRDTSVTLLHLFSPEVIHQNGPGPYSIAHPLLIYAELLYQGGDRERETAGLVYGEFLKRDYDGS